MVFGVAQVTAFFEENDQMGLSHCTRIYLQSEGIVRPDNLIYFTASEYWKKITKNCKCTARIPDPNNAGQTISQDSFHFLAQSLMCLKVAVVADGYYSKTSHQLAAANMIKTKN